MWEFFQHSNIALGFSILVFLGYALGNRRESERCGVDTAVPLLTSRQLILFLSGFALWTLALSVNALRWWWDRAFVLWVSDPLVPALYVGATMFLGHGLMYFSARPGERDADPVLTDIKWFHIGGGALLAVLTLWVAVSGPESGLRDPIVRFVFPIWQFAIIAHTGWLIWNCGHPIRPLVIVFLPFWMLTIVTETDPNPFFNFVSLTVLLAILLQANYWYLRDTFRRAASFKSQKDVMISYLAKLGREEEAAGGNETAIAFLGGFNLDRLLSFTLQYGLELCGASAGAMYVHSNVEKLFARSRDGGDGGASFQVHSVVGFYPPKMELGFQSGLRERMDYVHQVLRSESVAPGEGHIGKVAQSGRPWLVHAADRHPDIPQQHEPLLRVRSLLAVPLRVQGRTIAVMSFVNKRGGGESFTHGDEATLTAMAEQAAITIGSAILHNELREKDRLERELEFAREVQRLLLPNESPELEGFDIAAMSLPAQDVGGDYYDFIPLDGNRLAVVIADVSGKGFAAALTMASVRSALRARTGPSMGARELLIELNGFVLPDMRRGMFVTLFLAVLDTRDGSVDVARAGHDPMLVFHKEGGFESISPPGIALGVANGDLFAGNIERRGLQLREGDTLVLYTDGITEAMNPGGEEFTLERLEDLIRRENAAGAGALVERVRDRIRRFSEGHPQHDDQTLIVIRRLPAGYASTGAGQYRESLSR